MSEETAVQEEVKPPKSGSIGKMLLVVVLALVSSTLGGVVSFILMNRTVNLNPGNEATQQTTDSSEHERIAEMLEKSAVLPLEPFVVKMGRTNCGMKSRKRSRCVSRSPSWWMSCLRSS